MAAKGRYNALQLLEPVSPEDLIALYRLLREALATEMVSRTEVSQQLALIGARHLSGQGGRLLVRGQAGTGKTAMVRTLSRTLDLPVVEIDASSLAETNWRGADLSFYLDRLFGQLLEAHSPAAASQLAQRAVVFIDNFDDLRLPERYASSATRDYQIGRQRSLTPLLSGSVIPVDRDRGDGLLWKSDGALVAVAGRFDGIEMALPDAGTLASWGIIEPLANRLANCTHITLDQLDFARMTKVLSRECEKLSAALKRFGLYLVISDQAVAYAAEAMASGTHGGGPSAALAWIAAAADRILVRFLESGAAPGMVRVMAPDDLKFPDEGRGFWR